MIVISISISIHRFITIQYTIIVLWHRSDSSSSSGIGSEISSSSSGTMVVIEGVIEGVQ